MDSTGLEPASLGFAPITLPIELRAKSPIEESELPAIHPHFLHGAERSLHV